jgi:single-stranded DNA-binding protein
MRLNTVILGGQLSSDPAPGGGPTPLVTFLLSFEGPYGEGRGGGGRRRDFIPVVAFGKTARRRPSPS